MKPPFFASYHKQASLYTLIAKLTFLLTQLKKKYFYFWQSSLQLHFPLKIKKILKNDAIKRKKISNEWAFELSSFYDLRSEIYRMFFLLESSFPKRANNLSFMLKKKISSTLLHGLVSMKSSPAQPSPVHPSPTQPPKCLCLLWYVERISP